MVWRDFEVLLAVHRSGSHRAAARTLGVDPTTVGRRLAALDEAMRARMFDRTPQGLVLTAAGKAVLPRAERVEAEMVAAARELEGADARVAGSVRVTASDGFVQYVLVPALPTLRREQPALEIELRVDTKVLDLSRREADVAVRLSKPSEPSLVARRLGTMELGLYASRSYIDAHGAPRSTRDLASHAFVGFDASFDKLPQQRWLRRTVPELRYALRANLTTTLVAACAAGLGLALLPTFVAPHEPQLVRVLPKIEGPEREIWAVSHVDLRKNARVSLTTSWLLRLLTSSR
ncbi:MAG: LysR family transcriptional regulator [Polyangiales bacterium]